MKKQENVKLVTIENSGTINELGGISGPIINPCPIDISTIVHLIHGHKKVYEVNPSNPNQKVLLTLKNVNTVNFPQGNKVTKPKLGPTQAMANKVSTNTTTKSASVETKETNTETDKKTDNSKSTTKNDFKKK